MGLLIRKNRLTNPYTKNYLLVRGCDTCALAGAGLSFSFPATLPLGSAGIFEAFCLGAVVAIIFYFMVKHT